jgi:protein tyrosine/serine phosphatase
MPVAAAGMSNFYLVDAGVYRCEQPDEDSFAEMERMGISEVLNLRNLHSDNKKARYTSLTLHHVRMRAADPRADRVVEALRTIRLRRGDIVVHCWHGSDRTGLVVAMYRIVFQGWSKNDAIAELAEGGYGYHSIYRDIPDFIRSADTDEIRRQVFDE